MAKARKPAPKAKPKPGKGRPSRYHPAYAAQAEGLVSTTGATDARLAGVFGVSKQTISEWRKRHKDFREACERGREDFDCDRVKKAMYTRAIGYTKRTVTEKPEFVRNDKGILERTGKMQVAQVVREHVPADVKAGFTILFNRRPAEWKNKVTVDGEVACKHDVPPAVQAMLEAIYNCETRVQACAASHAHVTVSDSHDAAESFDPLAGLGLPNGDGAEVSA